MFWVLFPCDTRTRFAKLGRCIDSSRANHMPHALSTPRFRLAFAALGLMALVSCGGGGDGGGSVTLVSGEQDADPVVVEIPIAYVRRPLPETPFDLRDPLAYSPGAQLLVRERASATAEEIDLTDQLLAIVAEETDETEANLTIDIRGLESAYDGKSLVFAARVVPEPVAVNLEFTTWNLWLLDLETLEARYLIESPVLRNEGLEAGGAQDIAPHFLPDDRIVFSSTRQVAGQARLLDEGRAQLFAELDEDGRNPAAVLHIFDPLARGEQLRQISFNRSHDLDPTVLSTGEIVFSRWNNTVGDHISLFRIHPSGEGLSPLYGYHSRDTGTDNAAIVFAHPRELEDGRIATLTHSGSPDSLGGEIVLIDTTTHAEFGYSPTGEETNTPGHEGLGIREVRSDGALSPAGQYGSLYPLRDGTGRLLVTWSECRVLDPADNSAQPCSLQPENTAEAPPQYGVWIYDPLEDTQRPVVLPSEGEWISEIVAAENRDFPSLIPRGENYDADLAGNGLGLLRIRSLYDRDSEDISPAGIVEHRRPGSEAFAQRPARFLRFVQAVPLPDPDVFDIPDQAFGLNRGLGFREIAGYVPVEPDGSVSVTVPAERPLSFDVLDQRGRRIGARHNFWLQVAAGEVRECQGCHDRNSGIPHGLTGPVANGANPGARALPDGNTGFPATDVDALFALASGASMAETWDVHYPLDNPTAAARPLDPAPRYEDAWTAPGRTPEAAIVDRDYDPAWTDIPPENAIIARSFDPSRPGRIVINYPDHIQVIWERLREARVDAEGTAHETCVSCHSTQGDVAVPAGQLDLSALPSDLEPLHYRSFRELLQGDAEQWLDASGALADRQRVCETVDDEGNILTTTEGVFVANTLRTGSANGSGRFFACFEGGSCGPADAPPLPDNCIEEGEPVPATRNTVDHVGLLSESELHLISEWLDIGAQYYNNPFDSRLTD